MNNKQKFGYTLLGALIMLIGIGVGAIVSPPLIAQRNAVFGEIVCNQLKVVDKYGKEAVLLVAREIANGVIVCNKEGKSVISLSAFEDEDNSISVRDDAGNLSIHLKARDSSSSVVVYDKMQGAISLNTHKSGNGVYVFDKTGKEGIALTSPIEADNFVNVFKAGKIVWSAP